MSDSKGIIARISESITGVGGAIKGAVGAAREIQALSVDYAVKEKTHSLLDKLMDVQMQQMTQQELLIAAKERIIELEDEKKEKDNWESEAVKYELIQPTAGSLIYRIKFSEQGDQPTIYLCTSCYGKRKKSVLQFSKMIDTYSGIANMKCHECDALYQIPGSTLKEDAAKSPR
ncbi:hypothetical protein CBW53_04980 [Yersinia frederiksenii]|nr:hypothetical protein CBW53_04980 [Yersinia frederiksenii]CNI22093.1 Uncharacterised protein [Yersinia frederiksenii]